MIKRMGDEAALSTAALAAMAAMTDTPALQLGAARAARTSSSRTTSRHLDKQIAEQEQTIVTHQEACSGLVIEEGEADKISPWLSGQDGPRKPESSLLDRLTAAKQKTAAAARATLEARSSRSERARPEGWTRPF